MKKQQNWKTELFFFIKNCHHPDLAETVRMEPSQSGWTILIIPTDAEACQRGRMAQGGGGHLLPHPILLNLLEQVKTRQTEPRQGTASEPAEPRQSRGLIYMPVATGWKGGELIFRFRGIL